MPPPLPICPPLTYYYYSHLQLFKNLWKIILLWKETFPIADLKS